VPDEKPNLIEVEIFGQPFTVRAGPDPEYVQRLAAHVDAQMNEIARSSGAVDSVRIATLAALNITDELFQARQAGTSGESQLEKRARALADELTAALDE